jgi:hypothetical protein
MTVEGEKDDIETRYEVERDVRWLKQGLGGDATSPNPPQV